VARDGLFPNTGDEMNPFSAEAMWRPRTRPVCPECGMNMDLVERRHDCRVPKLVAAIGVPLTEEEMEFVRWLAGRAHSSAMLISILGKVKATVKP
jgi:hypothetical protein